MSGKLCSARAPKAAGGRGQRPRGAGRPGLLAPSRPPAPHETRSSGKSKNGSRREANGTGDFTCGFTVSSVRHRSGVCEAEGVRAAGPRPWPDRWPPPCAQAPGRAGGPACRWHGAPGSPDDQGRRDPVPARDGGSVSRARCPRGARRAGLWSHAGLLLDSAVSSDSAALGSGQRLSLLDPGAVEPECLGRSVCHLSCVCPPARPSRPRLLSPSPVCLSVPPVHDAVCPVALHAAHAPRVVRPTCLSKRGA